MVKVIMGLKGSGKTKRMLDLINTAVGNENGNVVCIEKGSKLIYDLPHAVRLVDAGEYGLTSFEGLRGFISGLYAGNYDISYVFVDGLYRIVNTDGGHEADAFLDWLESFSEKNNIKFAVTISADAELASETVRKYL